LPVMSRFDTSECWSGKPERTMQFMKKILLFLLSVVIVLMLPSCSEGSDLAGSEETVVSADYSAADDEYVTMLADYDNVTALCQDAFGEFFRAVKQGDDADFSPYMDNEALSSYAQYRAKNYMYSYGTMSEYRFLITGVSFHDEYAIVKGVFFTYDPSSGSESGEGYATFIVRNHNSRLVITEWYWPVKSSPDLEYRSDFSPEDNPDYWEDEANYAELIASTCGGGV